MWPEQLNSEIFSADLRKIRPGGSLSFFEMIGFQGSRVQGDKEVSKMLRSYKDLKVWQKA